MFEGSLVAVVTPMKSNGEIDYESFKNLVEWHVHNSTDGLVVLGTTGESPTITPNERTRIIRQVVNQVNGKIPVIVGTGTYSTNYSIELTQQAMALGADAALLVAPYYNKPTQEGLFQHFKSIAKAVSIPQILYNVPSRTISDILPETILRLTKYHNIVGVKEASGDIERITQLLQATHQLDLLSGDDKTATNFMLAGGKGVISVVANIVPKRSHLWCMAAVSGNAKLARQYDKELSPLYNTLFIESNPIPTKWALSQMNMISDVMRLPLMSLSQKYHDNVRQALRQVGIKI
ncbi:4-hydroxy-tetrahydrodipicolinate synthase [Coxiella endosymbiont of Amblyomma nuttalli]|uniref:4-hydroxy-tetrahydrodipicolinate synthase n=1 Tax=Coxiella endosymbiont of Amblyomma nuttalli TaxID=2749996 RepID=UPI001BA45A51|nr:4-hydroxy-tetrahydrodipicolinate synthase [Coxiella endosymbiont of Amblyomma nuttalli]QTS83914.1 4-hydroxy-tetrahydrodipicolinate synthase [Coxiella endosymbiont of Amblyomma nuttalli]